ncbi:MAG: VWA domain-containing protein [Methylovulum sp.]|nr:VWA domain-containing protein [Methylovulum sp.]
MSLADFHFIRPFWLLALLPTLGLWIWLRRRKLSQGVWHTVCDAELLPYLLQDSHAKQSQGRLALGACLTFLAIVALAGPTWQRIPMPVFRNASAWVIVLDLSASMDAEDIKPNRLTLARYKIADILKQRKDGQTALIVYAGDAFTVTPLTDDTETIANQLSALNTDIMPEAGSNSAQALAKAAALFKQAGLQKGQIILVTDGVDEHGLEAAKALDAYTVSVLGVGTPDGAPIPLPEGGFMKDSQGAIVVPKLNLDELKYVAEAGHGFFQLLTRDDSDIHNLFAQLDHPDAPLATDAKLPEILLDQWEDTGPWLLLLILPLSALLFRKGVLSLALLVLLPLPKNSYALEWQDLWRTKDQQAQHAFDHQNYELATKLFDNPDWKAAAYYKNGDYTKALEAPSSQTSDGFYNQGNALAQSGQYEQAIAAYNQALALDPNNADAKANKELLEQKQKQEKKKQPQKRQPNSSQNTDSSQNQNKPNESENKNVDESGKPEQTPEHTTKDMPQSKPQPDQQQNASQAKDDQQKQDAQPSTVNPKNPQDSEKQQADAQWLKRIPDDPAGLLKRKFKYQYGQRQHSSNNRGAAW